MIEKEYKEDTLETSNVEENLNTDKSSNAIYITLLVLFLLSMTVLKGVVPTSSMEPTIPTQSYILGGKLSYLFKDPKVGDIIIFDASHNTGKNKKVLMVKRVVGVPGDVIEIFGDEVTINGEQYINRYNKNNLNNPINENIDSERFKLQDGEFFVLGDNKNNSDDARFWKDKKINKKHILAKYWTYIAF